MRLLGFAAPVALLLTTFALGACGSDEASEALDGPSSSMAPPSDTPPGEPGVEAPETLAVAHERELRAAWIHFVWNGVWPSASDLTEAQSKAELVALLDGLVAARMNTVFLQVRTEGDAIYPSTLAPWSRFLTGTMGKDPGWDPLAFALAEAHARGLELHAWLNPYRALSSTSVVAPASHVTKRRPTATVTYGSQVFLDPGADEVRDELKDILTELLDAYDVDGIHFDDYFYPYPTGNLTFQDQARYDAYEAQGGTLDKLAWRRANVNALVKDVSELVADKRADVRFGISPFGIYKPGVPEGITGLDAYNEIACDPVAWMDEGWVDYLVPQLYWPTTKEKQAFGKLVTWWAGLAKNGRSVFVGHDVTRLGQTDWPVSEIELEMKLSRDERAAGKGLRGNVFFTARPIAEDQLGLRASLATSYWQTRVATPPLATALAARDAGTVHDPGAPRITKGDATVDVKPIEGERARSFAVYDRSGSTPVLHDLVPATADGGARLTLPAGRWAVSVVDRRGLESRASIVDVP